MSAAKKPGYEARAAQGEEGAALVIVLLLVATLSFILLSITTLVSGGVQRAASERMRTQLLWSARSIEHVATSIIGEAVKAKALAAASDEGGLFTRQFDFKTETVKASLRFADASRCFNVNSLIAGKRGQFAKVDAAVEEMKLLATGIGFGDGEAQELVAVSVDFMDSNQSQEIQGAEDGFYTALPTPYRTAGGPIASISEMRAFERVSAKKLAALRKHLCVRDNSNAAIVNVNALTPEDAPLIFALVGGAWPIEEIRAQIGARPPGGWRPAASFWGSFPAGEQYGARISESPTFIEARVAIEVGGQVLEETLIFQTPRQDAGAAEKLRLVARVFGNDL